MEEKKRCDWCISSDLYKEYHDNEWGNPVYDDATLFEFIILETFQAGLSWITILNKRENFRKAFDSFDYEKIALYKEGKTEELLQNAGIIRNKLKVASAITNAKAFMKIQLEFGSFSTYIWAFVNNKPIVNKWERFEEIPAATPLSNTISKDLKKRGLKFIGSTVVYAYMQATGMVNDHLLDCFTRKEKQNE